MYFYMLLLLALDTFQRTECIFVGTTFIALWTLVVKSLVRILPVASPRYAYPWLSGVFVISKRTLTIKYKA